MLQLIAVTIFTVAGLAAIYRLSRGARVYDCTVLVPLALRDLLGGDDE